MYIVCAKSDRPAYLKLVEGYSVRVNGKLKNKQRVIKNLGPLSYFDDGKGDYLARLRQSFKDGKPLIGELEQYVNIDKDKKLSSNLIRLQFNRLDKKAVTCDPKNIGYFLLESLYDSLGIGEILTLHKSRRKIKFDLNGLTRLLVFGRILAPKSKLATFRKQTDYLFGLSKSKSLIEVYRGLSELDKQALSIQKRIHHKIATGNITRNTKVCFYDVTNYFFTIDQNDEDEFDKQGKLTKQGLRKKGVSKEKRSDPIVQMGLFIDEKGLPIAYQLFPGNKTDQTTLKPALDKSIHHLKFNFKKVIIVADGGLNTTPNLAHIIKGGNGYVVSKSTGKSDKNVKAWILDQANYEWNASQTFKSKSIIKQRVIMGEDKRLVKIKEKLICYWSKAHYLRELKQNQKFIDYLESVIANPDKLKDKQAKINKYLKKVTVSKQTGQAVKTKVKLSLNMDKLQDYFDLLGYYTIITSEIHLPDSEIIGIYHGLSKIEDSFRVIKTDLEGRPVYVSTPQHINAHFLICFIALTLIRLIQYRILVFQGKSTTNNTNWEQGLSAARIKQALSSFQADPLPGGYFRLTPVTSDLKLILDSFGIKSQLTLPTISELHQLKYSFDKLVSV
jgi:transposase